MRWILPSAVAAAFVLHMPAFAHHSFAMFDQEKTVTMTGTVKEFEWSNPHAWMHMVVVGADGKSTDWSFEMGSVGQLARAGWKIDTVKPGDKLTMAMHPLKDGSRGGQYVYAITADGHRYPEIVPGNHALSDGNVPR